MKIASDHLNSIQSATLAAILDALIPASVELGMPSGGDSAIVKDVADSVTNTRTVLEVTLNAVDQMSRERHDKPVTELDAATRVALLLEPEVASLPGFRTIQVVLLQCYYRDARVMQQLGMEPRAPFPAGFEIDQGDWTLLDPVKARPKFYRRTD